MPVVDTTTTTTTCRVPRGAGAGKPPAAPHCSRVHLGTAPGRSCHCLARRTGPGQQDKSPRVKERWSPGQRSDPSARQLEGRQPLDTDASTLSGCLPWTPRKAISVSAGLALLAAWMRAQRISRKRIFGRWRPGRPALASQAESVNRSGGWLAGWTARMYCASDALVPLRRRHAARAVRRRSDGSMTESCPSHENKFCDFEVVLPLKGL